MDLGLAILLAAFAGGLFGAAIGGLPAFIFTGFAVLAGVAAGLGGSEFDFVGLIAFGPVFGPHISFAAGAAAAAYAKRRGLLDDGKDIAAPLIGLGDPSVLLVGGLFGLGGHVVQQALFVIIGSYTDSIALTVGISAIVARLAFGRSGLFGSLSPEAQRRGRFIPGEDQVWVAFQQGFLQASVLGLGAGILSAWMLTVFVAANPEYGAVGLVLGFGISAATLILLQIGFDCPVTHHMTLPAAVAAMQITGGEGVPAILVGGVFGILGALVGELFSRLFLIHGDTHVDPPANAIWFMTTVAILIGLLIA